jgi:hypothetical protein
MILKDDIIGFQQGLTAGTNKRLFGQRYRIEIFKCGVGVGISIMRDHQCVLRGQSRKVSKR